jgi:hypothetical protein
VLGNGETTGGTAVFIQSNGVFCQDRTSLAFDACILTLADTATGAFTFGVCDHLSELLQRPGRIRVCRHVHVRQTACAVLDDDEHVQHPKCRRHGDEEVAGEDGRGLIP